MRGFSNNEKFMSFKDHIGVDTNRKTLYGGIRRSGQTKDFKYLDCQIDVVPNALETFDENRGGPVRESRADADIQLGLHTLSAVNSTEISPYLRDACDAQSSGCIDAAARLNAEWIDYALEWETWCLSKPRCATIRNAPSRPPKTSAAATPGCLSIAK
jgi:hypothetical protein